MAVRAGFRFNIRALRRKVKTASLRPLFRAAGHIRKIARSSIPKGRAPKRHKDLSPAEQRRLRIPSAPGTPPKTWEQRQLRRSILFDVDKPTMRAVVGPSARMISDIGGLHEHGGTRKRKLRDWSKQIKAGGSGPIMFDIDGQPVFGKNLQGGQLSRARRNAATLDARSKSKPASRYEKRPFMRPALLKAGPSLSSAWSGVITP